MYQWGVFAIFCALLAGANASCEKFDIRLSGQTLLALNSDTKTFEVTNDIELGSLATNQIIMGDYIFGVFTVLGEPQLSLRKRIVDLDTGKNHVPRAIRGFAYNGTTVIYDHEFRDATEFTLAELRDFMRQVLAPQLAFEGHNDPFNLAARYTSAGEWCKDTNPLADCVATRDDIFEVISSEESTTVMLNYQALWERQSQPGDAGYEGAVQSLSVYEAPDRGLTLTNGGGILPGGPQFRYSDAEIQDVFLLQTSANTAYEVTPGVSISIVGWKGGQIDDFVLNNGMITGGNFIVGPHPVSDPNDVVSYAQIASLESRPTGPVLRFTPGRITRIYVQNADAQNIVGGVNWGFPTPHDQDGVYQFSQPAIAAGGLWIYEFQVPVNGAGTQVYSPSSGYVGGVGVATLPLPQSYVREYVLFTQENDTLNGNVYPGTVEHLSGWFMDTMRIKESKPAEDGSGDTIVYIIDEARLPHQTSNTDAFNPPLSTDCPAYGGPILGRYGTGCLVNGVHTHAGHNIPSTSFSPGTPVWISGHHDTSEASINGMHYVARETFDSFRIKKIGATGSTGGIGGQVNLWRLHKADWTNPSAQNTGASGGYFRFNYGEQILLRVANGAHQEQYVHLHGHTLSVVGEGGAAAATIRTETAVNIQPGTSVDVLVTANNPNRFGHWQIGNDVYYTSGIAAPSPWPDADLISSGANGWVDYTGFAQGVFALNADGQADLLSNIPPACSLNVDVVYAVSDNIGLAFDLTTRGSVVSVVGTAHFGSDVDGTPFGSDDDIEYSWTQIDSSESGGEVLYHNVQNILYVQKISDPGNYTFQFTAAGQNVYRVNSTDTVQCTKTVLVVYCPNTTCGANATSDLATLPVSFASPEITNLRLGTLELEESSASKKRQDTSSTEVPASAPIGHATFKLHNAGNNAQANSIKVLSGAPIGSPTANPLFTFLSSGTSNLYRHYNVAPNTDFWLDVDPSESEADWTIAVKQVVFDARLSTFGYQLATDLTVDENGDLPVSASVVFPLYQGLSTFGVAHDVYFLILSASDEDFCELYNCAYTPALGLASPTASYVNPTVLDPSGGVSKPNYNIALRADTGTWASSRATHFVFTVDPDTVPPTNPNAPSAYSPLKYVSWTKPTGEVVSVVANMPFIYWGVDDPQDPTVANTLATTYNPSILAVKASGCDASIQGLSPRPLSFDLGWDATALAFSVPGPPGCDTSRRGGQLMSTPDWFDMTVTMKLQRGAFDAESIPYFIFTDTSDFLEAQYNGVPWTPALNGLGRAADTPLVGTMRRFGNGGAGSGLFGFSEPLLSSIPSLSAFSPFAQITNLFWNCGSFPFLTADITGITPDDLSAYASELYTLHNAVGSPADIFYKAFNINHGGVFTNFTDDTDFYQLVANMKGATCPSFISDSASDGISSAIIPELLSSGAIFETENPAGSDLVSARVASYGIANVHVPFVWDPNAAHDEEDYTSTDIDSSSPVYQGAWVLLYRAPNSDGPRPQTLVAIRTLVGTAPYFNGDHGLEGDFPPTDVPTVNSWRCATSPSPYLNCNAPSLFNLDSNDGVKYNPDTKGYIQFVLLGCDNEEFATVFGSRYVDNLQFVPNEATSAAVWWEEPVPDEHGTYAAADIAAALESFVFGELPEVNTVIRVFSDLALAYSPLKTFTFQGRSVTCNMPFVKWTNLAGVQTFLVTDNGGCSADVRGDLFGSAGPSAGGDETEAGGPPSGPPLCAEGQSALDRSMGGQLLTYDAVNNLVTVKIHRAVTRDANQFSYFSIFDSSEPVTASYYGVPLSGRLRFLGNKPSYNQGVDTLKLFANGDNQPGNSVNFQDPIIGVDYSPLHAITHLLWNCDNALPPTAGKLFTEANYNGNACPTPSYSCDQYPLRVDLKWRSCPETVSSMSTNGFVYFNDDYTLIQNHQLFETFSPVGQPPDKPGVFQAVFNTPVVLQVNFNVVTPTTTGNHFHVLATENVDRWLWAQDTTPFVAPSATSPDGALDLALLASLDWVALSPSSLASLKDGTVGKIPVDVGDRVSFYSYSQSVAHSLTLIDMNDYATASDAVHAFFSISYTPAQFAPETSNRFAPVFGHPGYSSASPVYLGLLFSGVVRDNVAGSSLYFSDTSYGPNAMNGVLELSR